MEIMNIRKIKIGGFYLLASKQALRTVGRFKKGNS